MHNSKIDGNKKIIMVLGMHRSGTSAIARGLQTLGVQLGTNLFSAGFDNPKGFWEDKDVLEINEQLLRQLGAAYDSLSLLPEYNVNDPEIKPLFSKAIRYFSDSITRNYDIFGIKDPRLCRLLPFWKEVFSYCSCDVSYVLAIRNPLSVSASLIERNNFETEKNYLLWLVHVISSVSGTINSKRVFVDFDKLISQPERELNRIAVSCDLQIIPEELEIYTKDFLDNNLRHTRYSETDLLKDVSVIPLVKEVYQTLLALSSEIQFDEEKLKIKIKNWEKELTFINPALILADNFFSQISSKNQIIHECNLRIIEMNEQLSGKVEIGVSNSGNTLQKQVDSDHYFKKSYNKKGRFCSFWHQIDEVYKQAPGNILEIGKGNGLVADFLQKAGFDVSTLDINPDMNPTFHGSVLEIPCPDRSFDLVMCFQTLEHLPYEDFIPALTQLHRVSRKCVILSLPDMKPVHRVHVEFPFFKFRFFYPHLFYRPADWKFDGQHYWNINNKDYPLKKICKDLEMINFKIINHFRVPENPGHHFFILIKK